MERLLEPVLSGMDLQECLVYKDKNAFYDYVSHSFDAIESGEETYMTPKLNREIFFDR